jgi:kynurenine formamidase
MRSNKSRLEEPATSLVAFPLKLIGAEASPIRAVALL